MWTPRPGAGGRALLLPHNAASEWDEIRLPLQIQRPARNHRLSHTKAARRGRACGRSIILAIAREVPAGRDGGEVRVRLGKSALEHALFLLFIVTAGECDPLPSSCPHLGEAGGGTA